MRTFPRRPNKQATRMEITGHNTAVYHRPGGYTKIELDGQMMKWATSEWVCQEFLDKLQDLRNAGGRAPLGDSHGAWQKIAEVPFNLLADKIPVEAWEDQKAIAKVLNDRDLRYFRTDGDFRWL